MDASCSHNVLQTALHCESSMPDKCVKIDVASKSLGLPPLRPNVNKISVIFDFSRKQQAIVLLSCSDPIRKQ